MSVFFTHPVFQSAVADIESLGIQIHPHPTPGAKPYAVVGGRSNARWWLIPLQSGCVAASGLALFQPLLASARILKAAASALSLLGLSRLWVRNKVYITGEPNLARHFQLREPLAYAYFTGTDSPHRKVAVQIMDQRGRLRGYAKLTRNPWVRTLLAHEAATLERMCTLGLQTAYVPNVLYYGEQGDSTLLVTDTLKTSRTHSTTHFTQSHLAFVKELAHKTADPHQVSASELAAEFRARFDRISSQLDELWGQRLGYAIAVLEAHTDLQLTSSLSHGDFTPWNTFLSNERLYVFDWEYAEQCRPPSIDIIHFILNEPKMRSQSANSKIEAVLAFLSQRCSGIINEEALLAQLMIYLLTQTTRQIERLPQSMRGSSKWDGSEEIAAMFEYLLAFRAASAPV
jgi:thiamine kinase-like enzyme